MNDEKKTRKQLIEELNELRQCIAELKGFEEEIKQTRVDQEKFTKAFLQNSIPVGITTLKDGRFVDVSDAFLRLMGRKRDEVIGHTSVEIGFITKEQRASFFEELNKRGRVENLEMEVGTKGGALKYGLFNAVLMSTNNEKYLLAVMIDITDRKLMEKALAEEHQRLLSILDGSPVSSFVIDRDRKVTAWNMVNEFFTGLSKGDMLGKPLDLSPLYKDRVPPALADLVHEMSDEEIMKRYGHKGIRKSEIHPQAFESIGSIWIKGKERIMAIQATRLRDAAGSVIGAIQCAQDITTQKWSEEKLRKSEEKYRNLFENAAEGIYQVSPEGRFISVNPAAARMLGYESPEELIDTITDIGSQVYAYPEDRDKAVALLKRMVSSGTSKCGIAGKTEVLSGSWPTSASYRMIRAIFYTMKVRAVTSPSKGMQRIPWKDWSRNARLRSARKTSNWSGRLKNPRVPKMHYAGKGGNCTSIPSNFSNSIPP
jgi:PAS domain S-box-containing protein